MKFAISLGAPITPRCHGSDAPTGGGWRLCRGCAPGRAHDNSSGHPSCTAFSKSCATSSASPSQSGTGMVTRRAESSNPGTMPSMMHAAWRCQSRMHRGRGDFAAHGFADGRDHFILPLPRGLSMEPAIEHEITRQRFQAASGHSWFSGSSPATVQSVHLPVSRGG